MNLSTCAVCGGTITRVTPPDGGPFWGHVNPALDGHRIDPDDGHVSGPDRSDLPECSGCHHPEHEEGECEEEVSTGLYGTDGVLVYTFCACTGPVPASPLPAVAPDPWTDPDAAALASPPPF